MLSTKLLGGGSAGRLTTGPLPRPWPLIAPCSAQSTYCESAARHLLAAPASSSRMVTPAIQAGYTAPRSFAYQHSRVVSRRGHDKARSNLSSSRIELGGIAGGHGLELVGCSERPLHHNPAGCGPQARLGVIVETSGRRRAMRFCGLATLARTRHRLPCSGVCSRSVTWAFSPAGNGWMS